MTDLVDGDLTLRRAVPSDVPDVREVYSEGDTRRWMLWDDELPDAAEALANIERSEGGLGRGILGRLPHRRRRARRRWRQPEVRRVRHG